MVIRKPGFEWRTGATSGEKITADSFEPDAGHLKHGCGGSLPGGPAPGPELEIRIEPVPAGGARHDNPSDIIGEP